MLNIFFINIGVYWMRNNEWFINSPLDAGSFILFLILSSFTPIDCFTALYLRKDSETAGASFQEKFKVRLGLSGELRTKHTDTLTHSAAILIFPSPSVPDLHFPPVNPFSYLLLTLHILDAAIGTFIIQRKYDGKV